MKNPVRASVILLILLSAAGGRTGAQEQSLSLATGTAVVEQSGHTGVAYEVDLTDRDAHTVRVTVRLSDLNRQSVKLVMPSWTVQYAIRHFGRYLVEISAETDEGESLKVEQPALGQWQVETAGATGVLIHYSVYANEPSPYSAQLDAEHAFLNPAAVLMYLPDRLDEPVSVRFDLPPGWKVASTLEPSFDPDLFRADCYEQLAQSPVLASPHEDQFFTVDGMNVTVVIDGAIPTFDRRGFVQGLQRLVTRGIDLFGVMPVADYLFIIHFTEAEIQQAAGHPATTVIHWGLHSRDEAVEPLLQTALSAFLKSWLGGRIRPELPAGAGYTEPSVIESLWFLDGAAEYYAELLMIRSGLKLPETFLERVGSEISVLQNTPARMTQSATRASEEVWYRDDDWYRSPMRSVDHANKGFLLCLLLDLEMRGATDNQRSLDDLITFMMAWYGRSASSYAGSEAIIRAAGALTTIDLEEFLDLYITGTEELPYDRLLDLGGWQLRPVAEEIATTGFRTEAEGPDALVVTLVEEHSPAGRAGLRRGDRILTANGSFMVGNLRDIVARARPGDIITLRIRRRMTEEEITFALGRGNRQGYVVEPVPSPTPQQRAIGAGLLSGIP